jgi:hypothetical protein
MNLKDALQLIREDRWHDSTCGNQWSIDGEDADCIPSWMVTDLGGYGWVVRTLGCYRQEFDYHNYDTLVRVARAMDAASAALNAAL